MTLDEIAHELGISKSTVSRAMSGKGRIGKETIKRVQDFVNNQNRMEEEKKKMKSSTHNIGVVLPADIYNGAGAYFQSCLLGICEAASMFGYHVLLTARKQHDLSELKFLAEHRKVDGIVLTRNIVDDKALRYLTETGFPTALTGTCQYPNVIQVDTDNEEAAEKMTSILIGRGFRKFALIVKDMNYIADQRRHDGFCKALMNHDMLKQNQMFYNGPVKMEYLDSIIENLIAQKVECVICGDDEVCTMIMSRLQAEGYRIPMDIAVASLYNSPNLECYSPAVTAVNVPAGQMGNIAGKQLIQRLMGKNYETKVKVDYDIVIRKSTK